LSINATFTLKWIKWGLLFFNSILDLCESDEYSLNTVISRGGIEEIEVELKRKSSIELDNKAISKDSSIEEIISIYNHKVFSENTEVRMSLMLPLHIYILLSTQMTPCLTTFK
jgi:hypothetical protein